MGRKEGEGGGGGGGRGAWEGMRGMCVCRLMGRE